MTKFYAVHSEPGGSPAMIRVTRICRKCGAKIFSDAPRGLCTGCMFETALGIYPDPVAGVDCPRAQRGITDAGYRHHNAC